VSPKLPQISGQDLIKVLQKLGYEVTRQKGSHIRLRKTTVIGDHSITIPDHKALAKGTLNDILVKVSLWNNIRKDELVKML
jgi:predicted RNA binding protein YcfA (HicA-like mRNA interferase family)